MSNFSWYNFLCCLIFPCWLFRHIQESLEKWIDFTTIETFSKIYVNCFYCHNSVHLAEEITHAWHVLQLVLQYISILIRFDQTIYSCWKEDNSFRSFGNLTFKLQKELLMHLSIVYSSFFRFNDFFIDIKVWYFFCSLIILLKTAMLMPYLCGVWKPLLNYILTLIKK